MEDLQSEKDRMILRPKKLIAKNEEIQKWSFPGLNNQQQILNKALLEKDTGLSTMYLGTLAVLDSENPDKYALAAHDLRELMEKIPKVVEIKIKAQKETLKSKVINLEKRWKKICKKSSRRGSRVWNGEIDNHLSGWLKEVDKFFRWFNEHYPRRRAETAATLRGLDGSGRSLPAPLEDFNIEKWEAIRYYFQSIAHHRTFQNPEEFSQWRDDLEVMLLDMLSPRTYEDFDLIDKIIQEGEAIISSELVEKALSQIRKRDANYRYFFESLNSPIWIEPLFKEGMFKYPREPEREGDTIGFPIWPDSRYLARMATDVPEKVLEIALKIPDTENVRVNEDLADAALAMPANLAARLVPKAKDWLKKPYKMLLTEKLGEFLTHLTKGGQTREAVDLAGAILEVLPDPREEEGRETEISELFSPEPHARIDTWDYGRILKKQVPNLVESAGLGVLSILCDKLFDAVLFSSPKRNVEDPEDYSYIWRPAIEEHSQNRDHDIRGFLVSAVRDAGEKLIETERKSVLDSIEKRAFKVFLRIGLYLRGRFPNLDPEGTENLILKPGIYDDICIWHEFFQLLKERFGSFSKKTQGAYLSVVSKGPDSELIERWVDYRAEGRKKQVNQEEIDRYIRHWQYEKLIPIQTYLGEEWSKRFNRLKIEFGEPDHPGFHVHVGATWVGPTSPKDKEELRSMSIKDLISFLKSWQPSGEHMRPSPEGLSRQLSAFVKSEPDRFAEQASKFKGIESTYVRGILSGLRDALKIGRIIKWLSVIGLCQWAVNQPREMPTQRVPYANRDPGWGWTRNIIADLFSAGFGTGEAEIPFEHRRSIWAVIRPITDDPEPTPEDEDKRSGMELDPASLSINTARGEALHAVIRYALWVRRHIEKESDAKQRIERGFDEMPEVREVLDRHLDIDQDQSLAIRSVYGQWFPWLVLLDSGWAAQNLSRIFPKEDSLQGYYEAAWDTYILFCNPYDGVLDLLYEEYEHAIKRLSIASEKKRRQRDCKERLVEHLMSYYWRGKLKLDKPDALITQFFKKAPGALRAHAIEFMGRGLYNTKEEIDPETLGRLQRLWEQRINKVHSEDLEEASIETSTFGWWFASGKFDDSWSITQLKKVISITEKIEPDHLVVERLAFLAGKMPLASVVCLRKLVESDKKGWYIEGWRKHARTILTTAIKSDDAKAMEASINLIHRLGARGFRGFRDLQPDKR